MPHQAFSGTLAACLKRHYGGRIPSFATIARDFALHSPEGLAPISVETPRKWLRGDSLPSLERLQTLANWLGSEILEPLNGNFLKQSTHPHNGDTSKASTTELAEIDQLLHQLTHEELASIRQVLQHLVEARNRSSNGKA